jgi:hypothetical protein
MRVILPVGVFFSDRLIRVVCLALVCRPVPFAARALSMWDGEFTNRTWAAFLTPIGTLREWSVKSLDFFFFSSFFSSGLGLQGLWLCATVRFF